jgi:6-phosphogluconolactonase
MHLVGSYTPPHGEGDGIHTLRGHAVDLFALVDSPSFLAAHPALPLLYAVAEHRGVLVVVDARTGAVVQDDIPAGPAACHVRVAADGSSAVVACWGDGTVARYTLGDDGRVTGRVVVPPLDDLPEGVQSRAHASVAFGDGFVTTDLGADVLRVWSGGESAVEVQRLAVPTGSGPRHLVSHPNGSLYVVTEYSCEIIHVSTAGGRLELAGIAPARVGGMSPGDTAAEIALHPSGEWLTVGVRGSGVIAASRVLPDGSTEPVSEASCGGATPRHHVHDGEDVLVANQDSSRVTRLPFDAATGALGALRQSIEVGSPTFLLPVVQPAAASANLR